MKYKLVNRNEFLDETSKISEVVARLVGGTMTSIGQHVTLHDGTTTNDGATIVDRLRSIRFGENEIQRSFIKKLHEATSKTDELAGDGTSATTVITNELIQVINARIISGTHPQVVVNELLEFEKIMLEELSKAKQDLKTEKDYIKLATVSTKDDDLGELIGKAFYAGGENAIISMKPSDKPEDYVTMESNFIIPSTIFGLNIPTKMEDAEVVVVNAPITKQGDFLNSLATYAYSKSKNVIIICEEIGELALRFIQAANESNKSTNGQITIVSVPQSNQHEWYEDIAAYVGGKVHSTDAFGSGVGINDLKFGKVETFVSRQDGTILANKKQGEDAINKIKDLQKEMSELNETTQISKIKRLKERINMLDGKTIFLNVYAQNNSALQTKVLKIEDAVKATQYTLGYGYVAGAGVFYHWAGLNIADNIFKPVTFAISDLVGRIAGNDTIIDAPNWKGIIIDKKDGSSKLGDVIDEGIIDSAKVVENVIKNSVSIALEIAQVGAFVEEVEDEQEKRRN